MSCLSFVSISPVGEGESVSEFVAKAVEVIDQKSKEKGFPYELTAMGTIFETQDLKTSLEVVQDAVNQVLSHKNTRLSVLIKIDIRKGDNRIKTKVESVKNKLSKGR